jgi:hypothetical protein
LNKFDRLHIMACIFLFMSHMLVFFSKRFKFHFKSFSESFQKPSAQALV